MDSSNRRQFLKKAAAAGAAGLATSGLLPLGADAEEKKFTRLYYRDLGSTGYKATEIGFGAMNTRDAELVHAAIDAGINYLDTAHSYMNGANEEMVGTVMKTKRDKVFLVTKLKQVGADKHPEMLATSLKRLNTDHVDLVLLHIVESKEQCLDPGYLRVFEDFKKKGMTRFIGISSHKNQAEVLDAAIGSKVWDAALVGYNYTSPPEVGKAIERARKAGMAITAMKMLLNIDTRKPLETPAELRKGELNAAQAALRWGAQ